MANLVPPALSADEIASALSELSGWDGDERGLEKTYRFRDFSTAMAFMQDCIAGIEKRDHHPEWTNIFNKVTVHLDTWDCGRRVSHKDVDLAKYLDSVAERHDLRD